MTTTPTTYHILWDNGTDACGEFHWDFNSREAAEAWGEDWLLEFKADNDVDPDDYDQPSFSVIEHVPPHVGEDDGSEEELWDLTRHRL